MIVSFLIAGCQAAPAAEEPPADETVLQYDPTNIIVSVSEPTAPPEPCGPSQELCYSYSDITEMMGSDGLIVAGYATGLRESHYDREERICHTLTTFAVTDVYSGVFSEKSLIIQERFALIQDDENSYYLYQTGQKVPHLKNDLQSLLFLKRLENGNYQMVYEYLPLMPDYRNYNEDYLESVLDFYRGDRSVYYADGSFTETIDVFCRKLPGSP